MSIENKMHELKTDPLVFDDVVAGIKTHEIRFNDRDFNAGDSLLLRKTLHTGCEMKKGSPLVYTGDEITKTVSHVLSGYGLSDGWVILSFSDCVELQERLRTADEKLKSVVMYLATIDSVLGIKHGDGTDTFDCVCELVSDRDEYRQQIEASQKQEWQPIESAPTDVGSVAIIYAPSTIDPVGTVGEAFLGKDGFWYWAGAEVGYHDPIFEGNAPPTHWSPMLQPPHSEDKPSC